MKATGSEHTAGPPCLQAQYLSPSLTGPRSVTYTTLLSSPPPFSPTQTHTHACHVHYRQGPVYAALARSGYTLPGGTCVGVGISGHTLGGGLGHATRAYGLLADSVLQATVVLADGRIVTASDSSEPNLFWVRGGAVTLMYTNTCTCTAEQSRAAPSSLKPGDVCFACLRGCGPQVGAFRMAWWLCVCLTYPLAASLTLPVTSIKLHA